MSDTNKVDTGLVLINKEMMKTGYVEMGFLNLSLAEEGFLADVNNLDSYEKFLVESE